MADHDDPDNADCLCCWHGGIVEGQWKDWIGELDPECPVHNSKG